MKLLTILLLALALTGCGKSLDQVRQAGHAIIDIGFKWYDDVKNNVDTVKQILVEPGVPPAP